MQHLEPEAVPSINSCERVKRELENSDVAPFRKIDISETKPVEENLVSIRERHSDRLTVPILLFHVSSKCIQ